MSASATLALAPTYETGMRKWIITLTVVSAAIMELIDTSIVNVATQQIAGNLGASLEETAWVVTAYGVSNVVVIPMTGFLGSIFGRKNYFLGSIILFTISSFLCGSALSIEQLILYRFLQGIGGGALLATAQTILVETFPPEEIDKANGIFGLGIVLGPTLGPLIGGWIVDNYTWGWIFYINIPVGILAAFLTSLYIKDSVETHVVRKIDWWGIIFLIIGIGSLQMVLEEGQRKDWLESRFIQLFLTTTILGIGLFVIRELTTSDPVVDLRILKKRSVTIGGILRFVFGIGIFAPNYIYPIYVQAFLGWTATRTGLLILPSALLTGMLMGASGGLLKNGVNPKILVTTGFIMVFLYCYFIHLNTTPVSGEWDMFWPLIVRGFGYGFIFVPVAGLSLGGLKGRELGQASGITNMLQLMGGSVGLALINAYVTRRTWLHRNEMLSKVSEFSRATQERLAGLKAGFLSNGFTPAQAQKAAYSAIEGTLYKQASILSYADAFMLIGIIFLAAIPLIFLIKTVKGAGPVAGVH